ncbi:MAG: hypothetical protein LBT88_02875 [Oscillospiraceae bacterium]|jgi:hypothetical protein|nr:hypothetical protein [Oscillospiraceae bacterium]
MTHALKRRALSLTLALALIFSLFVGLTTPNASALSFTQNQEIEITVYIGGKTVAAGNTVFICYDTDKLSYVTGTLSALLNENGTTAKSITFTSDRIDTDLAVTGNESVVGKTGSQIKITPTVALSSLLTPIEAFRLKLRAKIDGNLTASDIEVITITSGATVSYSSDPDLTSADTGGGTTDPTTYAVSSYSSTNGSVTADKETAAAGETVTLTVAPSDGYQLTADSLKVKKADDSLVELTPGGYDSDGKATYTFTMPDGNVTVTAEFETVVPPVTKYNVNFSSMSNGTVTADKLSAEAGETVTLTVAPESDYRLKIGGIYYRPGGLR